MLRLKLLECAFCEPFATELRYSATQEMLVFVTSAGYLILQQPARQMMCAPLAAYGSAYEAYRALRLSARFKQHVVHAARLGKTLVVNVHDLTLLEHTTAVCGRRDGGQSVQTQRAAVALRYCTGEAGTQTLLIFDECALSWVLQQQQVRAKSVFIQQNALNMLKRLALQSIDLSVSAHAALLQICVRNVKQYALQLSGQESTEIVKAFDGVCAHSQLWRLLGFQGTRPENDFRASGALGLLAVAYFSAFNIKLLANASHGVPISTKKAVLDFLSGKGTTQPYRYPAAVSVITLTHSLLQMPANLLLPLLTSECAAEHEAMGALRPQIAAFCQQQMNGGEQFFADFTLFLAAQQNQNLQSDLDRPLRELCLCQRDRAQSALRDYDFYEAQLVPLRPIRLGGQTFSTAAPAVSGVFFKLVSQLVELLDARLVCYKVQDVYMSYGAELKAMMASMTRILESGFDVLGFEDLMSRMKE